MKRLLVLLSLFTFSALRALTAGTALASTPPPATAKYLALIVLDAGKPEYITNHLDQMPNMKAFLTHSSWYNRAWVGNLMSITPPDHAVIGTGSLPKDDGGIVNWDWGDHKTGKISPTLQSVENYENGWVYKLIKQSGTPTLAGEIRKKYPGSIVMAGSGAHFHAAGPMGGPDASWIFAYQRQSGSWAPFTLSPGRPVPSVLLHDRSLQAPLATGNGSTVPVVYDPTPLGVQDSLVVDLAIKSLRLYRPRAQLINLAEPDTIGHWSHQWARDEGILYRSFDKDLGKLIAAYKQAGIYNQTLFVITSDHGMIQSTHRVLDREAVISQIRDLAGQKSIILTNGGGGGGPTMTSIWMRNPAENSRVAQAVWAKHYDNVSAIYYMSHTGDKYAYRMAGCEQCSPDLVKAYNYLLSTEAGPTGEDIGILLRENARNSGLPQMMGRHGGADWGSQHVTLIMSGPGVRSGTSNAPARLVDLAPTMERFMGIEPNARDGVVLADAFQHPNSVDVSAQARAGSLYGPMAIALSERAASDIHLEAEGKLANVVTSNEIIIHWKRRLAVTVAGALVLIFTGIFLIWSVREVRRQGTGLTWTS